jgi:hypothetical protein
MKKIAFSTSAIALSLCCLPLSLTGQNRIKSAASYLERADKELQIGAFDRAIADYDIALQFDPNSAHAFYQPWTRRPIPKHAGKGY